MAFTLCSIHSDGNHSVLDMYKNGQLDHECSYCKHFYVMGFHGNMPND